ncbi:bifunctional copper resistance protein CopD/cytochrome c oxidase assembly protein [Corynebacterium sp. HS2168-gen11]|uniref:bifunctional copper resistance protein CopD/cytochrome c oxidase assembly protein n=1 Tax=Corynebacterium sp. HS2168-gen11 TaxID=2974027 RepID=UPI00216AD800|nr:bifunctional copper resistance protein CopD/cytochrome c oxidase assembly protein [Corynebacterium sp. HS2168-gen11]MCS4535308.1 bifunctional copper resistance protein CopD/cytochrome c oxidase assembly protein [Corynebacterium sp. HS2168-gen11]
MSEATTRLVARPTWPLYLAFFCVAGVIGATISWGFLAESLAALGIPDPGIPTTAGFPFLRAVSWVLAALAVGSFLTSAFFITPARSELNVAHLTVDGLVAARTGAGAALAYALLSVMMIPLVLSDVSGQPLSVALQPTNWGVAISQVAESQAWLAGAAIAGVVGIAGALSKMWRSQPLLLLGAIAIVAPLGLEGHSAAGGDHDYGTNSLLWHLLFMMLWVGGLMGLIAHGRRLGPNLALAVRRYSTLAFIAMLMLVASGLINTAIRVRVQDLFITGYGRVILAKTVLTLILALFGLMHRRSTMPKLEQGDTRTFLRVAIAEVVVMAATIGVAISLGRTPPPPPRVFDLTPMALEMGYDLTIEPTVWSVWTVWRFDIMFTFLAIVLTAAYIYGLVLLRRKGQKWPIIRTFWWLTGTISLGLSMSSGIGLYMPAMFSMHMVAHMALSMVIPVFLVLGAPFQLMLDATEPSQSSQPGLHEWVQAFLDSRILAFLLSPAFNTIQFITIFYLLYVTPWYDLMVSEHAGHLIMNWVFLLSGYIYYWEMIGSDPKPQYNSVISRLAWLVFSMPFHLYFGVYLMQLSEILAEDFYRTLNLPWGVDLMHDQNVGGGIAWGSGSFPLVIVFGTLFLQWLRDDRIEQQAFDEHEDESGDDDLQAYNEMLAAMRRGEGSVAQQYHQGG